jgi:hypothetical protein
MKKILGLLSILSVSAAQAAGTVDILEVSNDVVYFTTTEAKADVSPACMAPENITQWALSLNTETGKAAYALLVTASAANRTINVETAYDCADSDGFERAASVSLNAPIASPLDTKQLYLYKGDGVTNLGRIVDIYRGNQFFFFTENDNTALSSYIKPVSNYTIYFTAQDCTGTAAVQGAGKVFTHPILNVGKFIQSSPSGVNHLISKVSQLSSLGVCTNNENPTNSYLNILDLAYEDPLCGNNICVFKDE